ncbi:hypothetical protein FPQ18DRAFT_303385 [Pyronema domesticum]|nr:hypothetical protein FPQ18DRAFT_303385 [Pyronema domesticum]
MTASRTMVGGKNGFVSTDGNRRHNKLGHDNILLDNRNMTLRDSSIMVGTASIAGYVMTVSRQSHSLLRGSGESPSDNSQASISCPPVLPASSPGIATIQIHLASIIPASSIAVFIFGILYPSGLVIVTEDIKFKSTVEIELLWFLIRLLCFQNERLRIELSLKVPKETTDELTDAGERWAGVTEAGDKRAGEPYPVQKARHQSEHCSETLRLLTDGWEWETKLGGRSLGR